MKRSLLTFSILTILAVPGAQAESTQPPTQPPTQPLALRGIMQDLGRHMETITQALAREDWTRIEETAPLIADHPQPPFMEKARILTYVGTNMRRFKRHDQKTHEAAQALGQAAGKQDGQAVAAALQTLQGRCNDCHQEFRKPFVEHFYGAR